MSAGDVTPGRRVPSMEDLEMPGDYALGLVEINGRGAIPRVWFLLPTSEPGAKLFGYSGDNPHNGLHGISGETYDGEDGWTITEEPDGTISASPSIACGRGSKHGEYWHGYLEHGVWREV